MSFAFNPDDGPARLIRFVEPGTLPAANFLAVYVESQNLVIIDREHFERLSDYDRRQVLRTQQPYLEIEYPANRPARLAA
ncbi:hypothetical protein [Bradyrhizobium cenepequi]